MATVHKIIRSQASLIEHTQKQMTRTRWLPWGIVPNMKKNLYQSFSNCSQKFKQKKNYQTHFMSPLLPWYQNHTKTLQKRILQVNIFGEYICKNPQQNISIPNLTNINFMVIGWFNIYRLNNRIHDTSKRKDKNHMIISKGTEKHFEKIDDKNSYQSENTGSIH